MITLNSQQLSEVVITAFEQGFRFARDIEVDPKLKDLSAEELKPELNSRMNLVLSRLLKLIAPYANKTKN